MTEKEILTKIALIKPEDGSGAKPNEREATTNRHIRRLQRVVSIIIAQLSTEEQEKIFMLLDNSELCAYDR